MFYKRSLLFLVLFSVLSLSGFTQEEDSFLNQGSIGITFSSLGDNELVRFEQLIGAPGTRGKHFYTIGVNYLVPLNPTFELETGIEYSHHKIMVDPNLPPSMDQPEYSIHLDVLTLPFGARVNFLKYFFISAGGMINLDMSNAAEADKQTGLGATASLGAQYDFNQGISVFVNPYLKANGLLPFDSERHHQRLLVTGWRFGILYRLGGNNE